VYGNLAEQLAGVREEMARLTLQNAELHKQVTAYDSPFYLGPTEHKRMPNNGGVVSRPAE
jgi:hypothetical protein